MVPPVHEPRASTPSEAPSTIRPLVFDTSVIIFLAFLSLGDDAPHLLPGVLVNERVFEMLRKRYY